MNNNQYNVALQIAEFIEKNLRNPLRIDFIANKIGYSKWYMQRFFKDSTGMSLARYTQLRKLSACAISIRLTNAKIRDIALQYGYNSHSTFTTLFSRHYGVSPFEYRNLEEWSFEKILPRADLLHKIKKCSYTINIIKKTLYKTIMFFESLEKACDYCVGDSISSFYIHIGSRNGLTEKNINIPLIFTLRSDEVIISENFNYWLTIKFNEPILAEEIKELQIYIYGCILPMNNTIRRRGSDSIKTIKKNGHLLILEYSIPCRINTDNG